MKLATSSAALLQLLVLVLVLLLVLATATVAPATGSKRLPSPCQACCSGAPGASCPRWCPPCRTQCPAPLFTSCPVAQLRRRCRVRSCPRGHRCCFDGCRVTCRSVCRPPCPSGQKCSLDCSRPPCIHGLARCVPISPTCRGFPCPRGSRCVLSGGGLRCQQFSTRPGTCPVNDLLPLIRCLENTVDRCSSDNSCPRNQKCCSYGCSRTCVQPCLPGCRPDQKCVLKRPPGPCLGSDCPLPTTTCEPKDPCTVVDCKSGSRCVVRNGKAKCVPLSPRPGFCPANDVITTCEVRENSCTSDTQCKRGQKCCSRGCGRECLPACRNCRPGQTCRITVFPCLTPPCPEGARCVTDKPRTRPGVCPRNDIITTCQVRKDACISDAQCRRGQKCCSRGCGRACVSVCKKPCRPGQTCKVTTSPCLIPPCPTSARCVAENPTTRPGVCPRNDLITTCQVREDACRSDAQCGINQKCCSRGCGRACVSACQEPCPPGQECKLAVVNCLVAPCPAPAVCLPVDKPVVRPGTCSLYDVFIICSVQKDECTSDVQCKIGQKCCPRNCGRRCVSIPLRE